MTTRRVLLFLLFIVIVASLVLAGCNEAAEEDEDAFPPPPDASAVYVANCAGCHGESGAGGDRGPAIKPNDKDESELFTIIADGIEGTAMPAYRGRIGEGEVQAVIQYLREK